VQLCCTRCQALRVPLELVPREEASSSLFQQASGSEGRGKKEEGRGSLFPLPEEEGRGFLKRAFWRILSQLCCSSLEGASSLFQSSGKGSFEGRLDGSLPSRLPEAR
jgi:hypothetical protein